MCIFISGVYILFHFFTCLLFSTIMLFWLLQLYACFEGSLIFSALFFFLKIVLAIQDLLWFHMNFRIIFFYFCEEWYWYFDGTDIGILMWIVLKVQVALCNMDILTILILQILDRMFFHLYVSSLIYFINILVVFIEIIHFFD